MATRKKRQPDAEPESTAQMAASSGDNATSEPVATGGTAIGEQQNQPPNGDYNVGAQTAMPARENPSAEKMARGQFRSWVVDDERGYSRLTDQTNGLVVLQFAEKPNDEVLAAIKKAGFLYKPDHVGQKNAWVRRNDAQGRLEVESIEKLVRGALMERQA